jgi:HK97 family phage prohead protease
MAKEFASFSRELAQVEAQGRTLTGYASVFNYPIDSGGFGHQQTTFVRPGAFTQTLKQNRDQIQVLVNHGMDPRWGLSPVATVRDIDQDSHGLKVAADIIDHPEFDPIVASLKAGALRAMSIQFETVKEDFSDDRTERNLREVKLWEFGPVTFPANAAAVASLHSLTDFVPTLETMWDGAAALRSCSSAGQFRQIAFERSNDSDPDTAAHWALPHHARPGAGPDSAGVAAALAALHGGRGGAPDLKQSVATVERHLQGHQAESSSAGSRASTPDLSRLTWLRKASRTLEAEDKELQAIAARMAKLKEH